MKNTGVLLIGLNTFYKERSRADQQYIDHVLVQPKQLLIKFLTKKGFPDCDALLNPHGTVRVEENYYQPFKEGKTGLVWESFDYFDLEWIQKQPCET